MVAAVTTVQKELIGWYYWVARRSEMRSSGRLRDCSGYSFDRCTDEENAFPTF
jgi:hypothetical protein